MAGIKSLPEVPEYVMMQQHMVKSLVNQRTAVLFSSFPQVVKKVCEIEFSHMGQAFS